MRNLQERFSTPEGQLRLVQEGALIHATETILEGMEEKGYNYNDVAFRAGLTAERLVYILHGAPEEALLTEIVGILWVVDKMNKVFVQ